MPKAIKIIKELDAEKVRSAKLEEDLAAERTKNRQREFSSWLSSEEMRAKVSPAIKAELSEILEFAATTESFEFSSPDPEDAKKTVKVKQPPVDRVKAFMLRHLPDIITFGETATKKKAAGDKTSMVDAQEIAAKAQEFQQTERAAGRTITITEAVNQIMRNG